MSVPKLHTKYFEQMIVYRLLDMNYIWTEVSFMYRYFVLNITSEKSQQFLSLESGSKIIQLCIFLEDSYTMPRNILIFLLLLVWNIREYQWLKIVIQSETWKVIR